MQKATPLMMSAALVYRWADDLTFTTFESSAAVSALSSHFVLANRGQLSHGLNICFLASLTFLSKQQGSSALASLARTTVTLNSDYASLVFVKHMSPRFAVSNQPSPLARLLGQLSHGWNICFLASLTFLSKQCYHLTMCRDTLMNTFPLPRHTLMSTFFCPRFL